MEIIHVQCKHKETAVVLKTDSGNENLNFTTLGYTLKSVSESRHYLNEWQMMVVCFDETELSFAQTQVGK